MISVSDTDASREQTRLAISIDELLQSNRDLNARMVQFECRLPPIEHDVSVPTSSRDTIQYRPITASQLPSGPFPRFSFDKDLENSRVYQQIHRTSVDYSFRSSIARSHAWTLLSLEYISLASVVALPLDRSEISNARHYPFSHDDRKLSISDETHGHEAARGVYRGFNIVSTAQSGGTQIFKSMPLADNSNITSSLMYDQASSTKDAIEVPALMEYLSLPPNY